MAAFVSKTLWSKGNLRGMMDADPRSPSARSLKENGAHELEEPVTRL